MNRLGVSIGFIASLMVFVAPASAQQASRCADCHFAQNNAPAQDHLFDWDRSPHGRNRVGCDKCHGGNCRSNSCWNAELCFLRVNCKRANCLLDLADV